MSFSIADGEQWHVRTQMPKRLPVEAATDDVVFTAYLNQVLLSRLRQVAARTANALQTTLTPARDTITAQDYFRN